MLVLTGVAGAASAQADVRDGQVLASPDPSAAKLFVQNAGHAKAEQKKGKRWKVTLTDVDPSTLWFIDRPGRDAGRQSTASFVRGWADYGFASIPPNAVIEHEGGAGVAVELKNPRYDRRSATLVYTAILNPGAGTKLARTMRDVSIFIDDAGSGSVVSQLSLEFQGVQPNARLIIGVGEPGGESDPLYAAFIMGVTSLDEPLFTLQSPGCGVTVDDLQVTSTQITLEVGDFEQPCSGEPVTLSLPLWTAPGVTDVELAYSGPDSVVASAAINDGVAQDLSDGGRAVFPINP